MWTSKSSRAPSKARPKSSALPRIKVVAALIARGDTVLIQQRRADGPCANLWEFPGGKIERGEDAVQALMREAAEELGVALCVQQRVFETTYTGEASVIELHVFAARIVGAAEPQCHAAQRQLWCRVANLHAWPFCPADIELIDALVANASSVGGERFAACLDPSA